MLAANPAAQSTLKDGAWAELVTDSLSYGKKICSHPRSRVFVFTFHEPRAYFRAMDGPDCRVSRLDVRRI